MAAGSGSVATRLHVYASLNPAPTRTSSTCRRSRCSRLRWPTTERRSGIVCGTRSSTIRATSSIRSTSRVTSRARTVGTVTSHVVVDLEAEPLEDLRAARRGATVEPDEPVGPLGPEADDGPLQAGSPCTSALPASSAAGEIDDHPAGQHRGGLGEIRVDALLPAVRALGAEAEPLRRLAARRSARSSPPRAAPRSSPSTTSLSGAAHDRGQRNRLLAVGDQQVALVDAGAPCRRASRTSSPARACRTTMRPPASCERSKACSGLP